MRSAHQHLDRLSELWHISRTARAGETRYDRMRWTSQEFSKESAAFTPTAAYKALDRMLARLPASNDVETLRFINQVLDNYLQTR